MSNWYKYVEPANPSQEDWSPVWKYYKDKQILKEYFPYWKEQMVKAGKEHLISEDACIEDWVIINWAEKLGEAESILLDVIDKEEVERIAKEVLKDRADIIKDLADR